MPAGSRRRTAATEPLDTSAPAPAPTDAPADPSKALCEALRNPWALQDQDALPSISDLRDEFQHVFLCGVNLERVIAILANNAGPRQQDPITHAVHLFLTEPVVCAISPCGLLLFEQHPDLVVPFRAMTDEQRNLIRTVQCTPYREFADVLKLMGGGKLIVHFAKGFPLKVAHANVLVAVCRAALKNSKHQPAQKLQAANIIVQRAAALTTISNSTLLDVNTLLQSTLAAMSAQHAASADTTPECSEFPESHRRAHRRVAQTAP